MLESEAPFPIDGVHVCGMGKVEYQADCDNRIFVQ
jgi:hypothetical protein